MRRLVFIALCAAAAGAVHCNSAAAQSAAKASFTTIELGKCRVVRRHADGNAWDFRGLKGMPVYLAEGDLRTFASAGTDPAKRRAASQTLGPFNSPFAGRTRRFTIEWRSEPRGEAAPPFAMIYRLHTSTDNSKGQVLVVAKVGQTDTCQVAIIDALANDNAVGLAREIADGQGRDFDCKSPPKIVGRTGKSPL
jgi:hypothetical protein